MNITREVIKQFIITRIIPPLAGALATWLITKVHFLSIFHFKQDETAKAISELAIFGITTAFAWLSAHYSLKGHYLPGKTGTDQGGKPEQAPSA
jgi:hypothetical protein